MKIKNIQLSFIVFFLLLVGSYSFETYAENRSVTNKNIFLDSDQDGLSDEEEKTYGTDPNNADTDGDGYSDGAEVNSGYNPLKHSPGDKLIPDENDSDIKKNTDPNKKNLTQEVSYKVAAVLKDADEQNKQVSVDQVKSLIQESLDQKDSNDEMPVINEKDIKIKKQDYGSLSEEKRTEKMKKDMVDYLTAISYVLITNSPEPISSNNALKHLQSSITNKLVNALTSQNSASLDDLSQTLDKIDAQMKDIEVPQEMLDTHIKGLQLMRYASKLKDTINPVADDPLSDLVNYSRIQSLLVTASDFNSSINEKIQKYDLKIDDVQSSFENLGVPIPDDILQEAATAPATTNAQSNK